MTRTKTGRARLLAALAGVAAVAAMPLHVAADPFAEGNSAQVLTFTAPTGTIQQTSLVSCSPHELGITGNGVIQMTMNGNSYAGPVSFTGSLNSCEFGSEMNGTLQLVMVGDAGFGQFNCGTPAQPLTGVTVAVHGEMTMGVAGFCTINGVTEFENNAVAAGVYVPSGLSASLDGVTAVTYTSAMTWSVVFR